MVEWHVFGLYTASLRYIQSHKEKIYNDINLLRIRITGILNQVGCFFVLKQEVLDGIHPFVCRL